MLFRIKNTRATYQRMINKVFKDQISRNLEVYVDDMLIKSRNLEDHLADLEENFNVMRANRIRINPTKCTFRVVIGQFLGFMLIEKGIEVNPTKCRAIMDIRSLSTLKEVQKLNDH